MIQLLEAKNSSTKDLFSPSGETINTLKFAFADGDESKKSKWKSRRTPSVVDPLTGESRDDLFTWDYCLVFEVGEKGEKVRYKGNVRS